MPLYQAIERLRQPEYTGDNRCWACTVVNSVLAVLLAIAIVALPLTGWFAGIVFLLIALASIYLRGYLVPGTPTLTKRYFPVWLLELFGKEPVPTTEDSDVDVEALLERSSAIEECRNGEDVCLTDEFREAWRDRIRTVRNDEPVLRSAIADMIDAEAAALELDVDEHDEDAIVAELDDRRIGHWPSRAALVADMAAAPLLEDDLPELYRLTPRERSAVIAGLRVFLERCPKCEARIEPTHDTVESCCHMREVVAINCPACEDRILEIETVE